MEHFKDEQYKGHEYIIYHYIEDGDRYAVDIRADDYDGDIIAGYKDFETVREARRLATAYIDGYEEMRF